MRVDALGANLPGGEFFGCPLENSAEGEISFAEFPAVYRGREVSGIRLRFDGGRVVDASAAVERGVPAEMLDTDEGARRLGELGIGCNPGITRYMKNTLFDEKMDGTVHLALGNSYTDLGGVNESRDPLGPRQGPASGRARGSSSTEPSCSRTAPGSSEARPQAAAVGAGAGGGGSEHVLPEVLEHPRHRPERRPNRRSRATPAENTRAPAAVS